MDFWGYTLLSTKFGDFLSNSKHLYFSVVRTLPKVRCPPFTFPIPSEYKYKVVFMCSWPIIDLAHLRKKANIWTAILLLGATAYPTARIKSLLNYNNISFP